MPRAISNGFQLLLHLPGASGLPKNREIPSPRGLRGLRRGLVIMIGCCTGIISNNAFVADFDRGRRGGLRVRLCWARLGIIWARRRGIVIL